MLRRVILASLAVLTICACKPAGKDQRSAAVPPDWRARPPAEPANAPASSLAAEFGVPLDLEGVDPAWALKIRRDSLSLSRPGKVDVMAVNAGPVMADGTAAWSAVAAGKGGALKITVKPAPCVVGMKDREYPYQATVETDGEKLLGCAAPATGK